MAAPQRKAPPSGKQGYYADETLRKRQSSAKNATNTFYDDNNKPELKFEKKRPVTPPSYNGKGNSVIVETAGRAQPKKKQRKQPRIVNKDTGEVFILCGNEVSIGSSRKSDIRLHGVEKLQNLLVLYEDGWAIDRVKGKSYLNGYEIKSPQLLFEGDIIAIGDERLHYYN